MEAVHRRIAVCSQVAIAVLRAEGGGRIFDKNKSMLPREMPKGIQVGRQADLMNQRNGSYRIIQNLFNRANIEVKGATINIREYWDAAGQHQAVHRCHARMRRHDHLVAGLQSGDLKGQMQGAGC